ncbi:MAG: YfhO family protein [bacterium]|nr:YfhO family protein [bacterium]
MLSQKRPSPGIVPDLIAVTLLVALWALFFWRLLTPNPNDRLMLVEGDFSGQFVAFGAYQYQRLTAGELPLWNPYNNGGLPFVADTQAAAFYPPRLLTIGLSWLTGGWTYNSLQLEMTAHVLVYTLLMYAFVRRLTWSSAGSVPGAITAALIAGYGGFMSGYPPLQLALLEAAIWLPLGLLGIVEATRTEPIAWHWLGFTGLALGLSWMAGHPQTSWFSTYFLTAYLAYRIYVRRMHWRFWFMGTLVFGLIAFALAAVQLLPGVEYLARTARLGLGFDDKGNGFPFQDVVQLLIPGVVSLWSPLYIGVVGLVLVGAALLARVQERIFWGSAAIIALGLSFGANSVIFHALYNVLPGLSFFRGQERAAYLVSVCLAVLAGLGMAALADTSLKRDLARLNLVLLVIAGLITGAVFVAWLGDPATYADVISPVFFAFIVLGALLALKSTSFQKHTHFAALLIALLVFDLFSVSMENNMQAAVANPLATPPLVAQVQADSGLPFRVDGGNSGLRGNDGSLYNLMDMRGISPLFLDSAHAIVERELPSEVDWELFAVRYVFAQAETIDAPSQIVGQSDQHGQTVYLHRLDNPRLFALLVYAEEVVDSDAFARVLLADPRFEPRTTVILNRAPDIELPQEAPLNGEAVVTAFAPERFTVEVSTPENALLTLSHLDYPGWRAMLDGETVGILRAYGAFSAVAVPAGEHTVELTYNPLSFKIGAALSLAAWAVMLIGGVLWLVRANRRTKSENG